MTICAGRLTIYLAGELDHHEARGAIRSIEELLDEYLPRDCVLDMSGLSFMDSSGIAVVLRAHRRMAALGGNLIVTGVPAFQACRDRRGRWRSSPPRSLPF